MTVQKVNGARHNWGPREFHKGPAVNKVDDVVQKVVVDFDYANLPAAGDVGDAVVLELPKFAVIKSAYLLVKTAFAGGTSYAVGFKKAADGLELDDDGLIDATAGALANIDANGDVLVGAGALIGKSLSEAGKIAVTAVGTFTAGEARLVVEYIHPGA